MRAIIQIVLFLSIISHANAKEIDISKKESINDLIKNINHLNVKQLIFRNYDFKKNDEYKIELNDPEEINNIVQAIRFEPILGFRSCCTSGFFVQFIIENYEERRIIITICEHRFEVVEELSRDRNHHSYKMPPEFYKLIKKYFIVEKK